jgi:pimeloyl-ACP methyl ester carboxylesterase
MLDDLRSASPGTARAAARDFWLFSHEWDIDLAQARVPVDVWHGTVDRNVPVAHASVIAARCPTAHLHLIEGGGHMLVNELDEILETLTSRQTGR